MLHSTCPLLGAARAAARRHASSGAASESGEQVASRIERLTSGRGAWRPDLALAIGLGATPLIGEPQLAGLELRYGCKIRKETRDADGPSCRVMTEITVSFIYRLHNTRSRLSKGRGKELLFHSRSRTSSVHTDIELHTVAVCKAAIPLPASAAAAFCAAASPHLVRRGGGSPSRRSAALQPSSTMAWPVTSLAECCESVGSGRARTY